LDTDAVEKMSIKADEDRWSKVFQYIESRLEVEDVVISGGDSYRLRADQIRAIGERLLLIPHVRRWRYATKGLAVQPMKILSDEAWVNAITDIADKARKLHKEVVIHTHFNHPAEITEISARACNLLMERGITVRNQSVLQRGVNDTVEIMQQLVRRLSWINVHPYYAYVHDLVRGTEDLRTSVSTAVSIEKGVRGSTAGFNTPLFVVDAPGGGGKRDAHSFEHYNRETGISVYSAPSVRPGESFCYFDPLVSLNESMQAQWKDERCRQDMIAAAVAAAGI
jgi:lysine 2,3-aminomutase